MLSEPCAYHEAGHAVVAHMLGLRVHYINLEPEADDEALRHDGEVFVDWEAARFKDKKASAEAIAKLALGGPSAEMIHIGETLHPGLVLEWSQDWRIANEGLQGILPDERQRVRRLEELTIGCYHYLSRDEIWQAVASLVDELLAHEQMEGQEIHEVLNRWMPAA